MPDSIIRKEGARGFAIAAGIAAIVAIALFWSEHWIFGGIAALVVVLLGGLAASGGSSVADCPSCGKPMTLFAPPPIYHCPSCGEYSDIQYGKPSRCVTVKPDYVAPTPSFAVEECHLLNTSFPNVCCVCGGPVTRSERITLTFTQLTLRFDIPHCGLHSKGVERGPHALLFRSMPYYREFCRINRLDLRHAPYLTTGQKN